MAYCANCGNTVESTRSICPICNQRLGVPPPFPIAYQAAEGVATYRPAPGVSRAPNPPMVDADQYERDARLGRRIRRAMPKVFFGAAGLFLFLVITALLLLKPAEEVLNAVFNQVTDKVQAVLKRELAIENIAAGDAAILDYMGATASKNSGDGDQRIDALVSGIRSYVSVSQQNSVDGCPSDFVAAYQHHVALWSDLADVLARHPHIPSEEETFVRNLLEHMAGGSGDGGQDQAMQAWTQQVREAQSRANQGTQDFIEATKSALGNI